MKRFNIKNEVKKIVKMIFSGPSAIRNCWSLKDKPTPIYTRTVTGGLKLHLGTGPINLQGWVNIDARLYPHIHMLSDGFDLKEFKDGVVEEIYLCHVLEHFSFKDSKKLISSLREKLINGGTLRISVPCFDSLIKIYKSSEDNLEQIKQALMGGQDYEYNFHKSIYNKKLLSKLLTESGFSKVSVWDTHDDFGLDIGDWSTGNFFVNGQGFPVSLNLKACKN